MADCAFGLLSLDFDANAGIGEAGLIYHQAEAEDYAQELS